MNVESPYMTRAEATAYLRYTTEKAFMRCVVRLRTPHVIRGRQRLFLKSDLDQMWKKPIARVEDALGRQKRTTAA